MLKKMISKSIVLAAMLFGSSQVLAQNVVLVTHVDNPVDSISQNEAKSIFLGKKFELIFLWIVNVDAAICSTYPEEPIATF